MRRNVVCGTMGSVEQIERNGAASDGTEQFRGKIVEICSGGLQMEQHRNNQRKRVIGGNRSTTTCSRTT